MFSNIIYFIIVLLIYNLSLLQGPEEISPAWSLAALLGLWAAFAAVCRREFHRLFRRSESTAARPGWSAEAFQRVSGRLSILAVAFFGFAVYFLHLKHILDLVPAAKTLSALHGVLAVSLFILLLCTLWYFAHPPYCRIFRVEIPRRTYVISQLRLNLPILFPWVAISLVYDMIGIFYPSGAEALLNRLEGHLGFIAGFLLILMAVMPGVIQSWWGCRPFEDSEKKRLLEGFLREHGFRYRALLRWPLLEGKTLTAGIMGIVPRYRYILVTDALYDLLSVDELKAVLAHEMGHARYRHLLFYLFFFIGYAVLSYGMFDLVIYLASGIPYVAGLLSGENSGGADLGRLLLSIPMLAVMIIYFRFVMGFFMRNFERQADLYSARLMGTAGPIINSLEKIAYLGGRSRDVPSWHHFSISERVAVLERTDLEPDLLKRHNRFLALSFAVYILCVAGLSYGFNAEPFKRWMVGGLVTRSMEKQILQEPRNLALHQSLAMLYHRMGRLRDSIRVYERVLEIDPGQPVALNNLAWILATAEEQELRDHKRALELARAAAGLERSAVVLDTLAEAYYVNGLREEALAAIEEAISLAKDRKDYYLQQKQKLKK
jgi:Zn-dependent protease with chaperone function